MMEGMVRAGWLILAVALGACGDDSSDGPSDVMTPPPLTDCHWLGITAPETVAVGQTATLSVYRQFCRPNFFPLANDQVQWSSGTPATATVTGGVVTAQSRGAAVIGAAYGQITQQVLIVVGGQPIAAPPTAQTLGIYGSPSMTMGQRGAFGAFVVTPDGAVARVTAVAGWRSSNPQVLGVSGTAGTFLDRTFDAHAAGTATVTATYGGATATMPVDVR